MSIIHMDSCDLYGEDADITRRWSDPDGQVGGNIVVAPGEGRFGEDAIGFGGFSSLGLAPPDSDHVILGFWWKVTGSDRNEPFQFTNGIEVELQDDMTLTVKTDAHPDTTTSEALAPNVWNFIEFEAALNSAVGGGLFRLWVNGNLWVELIDTTNDAPEPILFGGGQNGEQAAIDDIYVIDPTVSPNTSPLGPIRIGVKAPDADTADADFVSTEASNHAAVDDVPDDDDLTHVESSTVGHKDMYGYAAADFTSSEVLAVQVATLARDPGGGTAKLRSIVRESGIEAAGASSGLSAGYGYEAASIFETNPATSAPWTPTELDALEAGFEVM